MPPRPEIPAQLRTDVFLGVHAVRSGLLTPRQLQRDCWRSVLRGVYVHRDVPVTHELRARAASLLLPDAVVTGRSAATLWGVGLAQPKDDVEVTLSPGTHPVRITGLRARRALLETAHVWRRRGLPVTSPVATALRLSAALDRDAAVAAVDQLVAAGLVDLEDVRRLAYSSRGPGSARARTVTALADGLAASPQETRLRLLIGRSPLPAPIAQFVVRSEGRFIARVDFAWPERRLAVEYDGLWHAEPGQFAKDRRRLNRLQAAGWRIVFVTAADLQEPERLIALIAAALAG